MPSFPAHGLPSLSFRSRSLSLRSPFDHPSERFGDLGESPGRIGRVGLWFPRTLVPLWFHIGSNPGGVTLLMTGEWLVHGFPALRFHSGSTRVPHGSILGGVTLLETGSAAPASALLDPYRCYTGSLLQPTGLGERSRLLSRVLGQGLAAWPNAGLGNRCAPGTAPY